MYWCYVSYKILSQGVVSFVWGLVCQVATLLQTQQSASNLMPGNCLQQLFGCQISKNNCPLNQAIILLFHTTYKEVMGESFVCCNEDIMTWNTSCITGPLWEKKHWWPVDSPHRGLVMQNFIAVSQKRWKQNNIVEFCKSAAASKHAFNWNTSSAKTDPILLLIQEKVRWNLFWLSSSQQITLAKDCCFSFQYENVLYTSVL